MRTHRLIPGAMAEWWRTFFKSPRMMWPVVLVLAALDGAGIYVLMRNEPSKAKREAQLKVVPKRVAPIKPPPPAMIHPPAVATVLKSGTLIVISKKSQNMFVFSDGALWASTPISTGKRRHETPSGVFPILQKRRHHRSNIYSNAPMPFMQRLTWDGIALHAGRVPGYAASHGCIRMPRVFAQALFKLTKASTTTVVIGDDPLETEVVAQQFALTAPLKVHSALAPPPDPPAVKPVGGDQPNIQLADARNAQPRPAMAIVAPPPPVEPPSAPPLAPVPSPLAAGQTIQLTAAASLAEAEAHWAGLLKTRPDMSRFVKTVAPAIVNSRRVYRLRISGAGAHSYCLKLKNEGVGCLNVG